MAVFSQHPLQKAIYQTLSGDATLMGLVTGVYDRPPQGSAFPYITLGESEGRDWSTKTTSGMEQIVSQHVWSREGGRKQASLIMERIHTLLHDAGLSVEGQTLISLRFSASSLNLENDGWTYHGILRFRAFMATAS
jgi:hypothetical protein